MAGVEGTIIDSDSNQPIQGVNISYRSSGTTSDKNGNFFINAQEGEKIKFSHIGYRELELMAKTKMEIVLFKKVIQSDLITVTGGFENESLLNSTSVVKVLSKSLIKKNDGSHFQDIMGKIPNLNFAGGTSRPRYFQIRGIGERSHYFGEGAPNFSVGFVIDDIDLTGLGMSGMLYDLEQIEIFKGPQSAVYGPNAFAGLINFKSMDPADHIQSSFRLVRGIYNLKRVNGMFNLPLINSLSARVVFESGSIDGYHKNKFLNKSNTNGKKEDLIRKKLSFTPNESINATLTVFKAVLNNNYDAWAPDNNTKLITYTDKQGVDSQETGAYSLRTKYSGGKFDAEVIFSESKTNLVHAYDGDWGNKDFWLKEPYLFDPNITGWEYDFFDSTSRKRESQNLEARINYGNFLVGVYSRSMKEKDNATGYLFGGDAAVASGSFNFDILSVYSQIDYYVSNQLRIIGNIRKEMHNISYTGNASYYDWYTYGYEPFEVVKFETPNNHLGGKIALQFIVNERKRAFTSISRGYKPGGINQHPSLSLENREYNPEYITNFDIGLRSFSNKSKLHLAVFYANRINQQVSISSQQEEGDPNSFKYFTSNATSGFVGGLEIDATYNFNSSFSFTGALGVLRTNINKFEFQSGSNTSIVLGSREAAHAPNYSFNLYVDYTKDDGFFSRIEIKGKDKFYFSDNNNQFSNPYEIINAHIGYKFRNLSIRLWGENIFDKRYAIRGFYFGLEPIWNISDQDHEYPDRRYISYGDPSNYGITINYLFN
ncbi:MAG: hypothetical protein CMG74_06625 [Candidatus Marinimicrobia bacterium]|nr:hypothetical protein [Candidatus Neomarinimicrobiota bacterium]